MHLMQVSSKMISRGLPLAVLLLASSVNSVLSEGNSSSTTHGSQTEKELSKLDRGGSERKFFYYFLFFEKLKPMKYNECSKC
jgi:hypothetical protein